MISLNDGKFGFKKRLFPFILAQLSGMLMNIQLSAEIHRKFRSFQNLRHWKGSEFSSFLFYASVVCFKSVMSSEQHKHFMLYFCAITLFSSDVYKEHWPRASNLLQLFVKKYADIYGPQFVSSNIHNLLHVYKEVKHFGPLYTLSSYKFENLLQQMKLLLRNGYKCLEQVINRLLEQDEYYVHKNKDSFNYPFILQRGNIITLHIREAFCLKYGQRNGWFLTKSGYVCQYINAVSHIRNNQTNIKITAKRLINTSNSFDFPFDSKIMHLHRGNLSNLEKNDISIDLDDVKCKLVAVPLLSDKEFDFVPLVHTIVM